MHVGASSLTPPRVSRIFPHKPTSILRPRAVSSISLDPSRVAEGEGGKNLVPNEPLTPPHPVPAVRAGLLLDGRHR